MSEEVFLAYFHFRDTAAQLIIDAINKDGLNDIVLRNVVDKICFDYREFERNYLTQKAKAESNKTT